MPTTPQQQVGSRGRRMPSSLPLLSVLFIQLTLTSMPGHAAIYIPDNYQIKDLQKPPVITVQPASITAFSSDEIFLNCEATGNPPPRFRWVKDGLEFDPSKVAVMLSPDSGSFKAEEGAIHHFQGNYSCYASNNLGTAVSNEVQIITEDTPAIQKEKKEEKTVEEGNSAILHCNPPESSVTPVIHWMDKRLRHIQQSERVTQGRDGNLYFSHVTTEDSRSDYTCNVQFLGARIIVAKEPISLKILPSNSVVRNRRPQMMRPTGSSSSYTVLRGQMLDLECITQGLPTPSIQWVRKDGALSESRTSTDSYNRVLRFSNISQSDDGEYQCTATNTQGTARHTYTVTVEAAPYWIKEPESELYAPNETVRLECQADGIPTPTVTWSINGSPLSGIDEDSRRTVKGGTLILKNVAISDTAVYQCKASNIHGNILVNTYVYVVELPPQILTENSLSYTVTEGQMAELQCKTFGSPRPKVTWEDELQETVLKNSRMTQLSNGTLQIINASREDKGSYTCSVKEAKISITAELEVLNRTVILDPPRALHVQKGKSATFTCQYQVDDSLAKPQVLWRRSGKKLDEFSDGDKYMIEETELIVSNVQEEDEGIYTCEVMTSLDSAKASGSITVVDRPDAPTQLKITEPRERSVTLSWTPEDDHKSPVLEYVVEFEETGTDREEWEEHTRVAGDTRRISLSLRPFLAYRFRVIAINSIGKSDPSLPSEPYSTPAARPDSNPEAVQSESVDPDTLFITWDEMDRRNFNGPDFRYKVMWRKVVGSGPSWHSNFTLSPPFVVTDVGNFTAFDIKVQAVNDIGEGPDPKSTIGYSGEDYPQKAPLSVGVVLLNSTAVTVTWAPVERESVRGHLMGYKINLQNFGDCMKHHHHQKWVRDEDGQPLSEIVIKTGPNEERKELGGLQPYSCYSLFVNVFNGKGDGPPSEDCPFETPEGVPGPPTSLELISPSETEMTLQWTPPAKPNGILIGYLLQYQQLDNTDKPMQVEKIDDPKKTQLTLKKLDSRSRYRFDLRGRTNVGSGMPIVKEGATTLDGAPPHNISFFAGETSVNFTWVTHERQRNVAFHINYLKKNDRGSWKQSEKVNTSQSFYTLRGLQPGSQYRLHLVFSNVTFKEIEILTEGAAMEVKNGFATEGWFIGLISALVLLLLILLILCFIKRSKGGKYSVKEKEEGQVDSEVRPMKDETFGEYRSLESDNEEKRTASQPSLCEDSKLCSDGALDYGNSNSVQTEVIMDESLASQYSGARDEPEADPQDSSFLTPVSVGSTSHGLPNSAAVLD
ncbi:neural cell adhesion molecule L1.2 isoform X2 [Astyanax mexicanus]|uniref:neural cell adhesion molecule L1.2 isoform X2 n=1 Tax=Astyanax mexicanus TaxID=7994 RepID=UPI0020CAA055|nr:neural cell adhesion molecule L1.2 isoform X2 [Astyanax mexicanus]